MVAGAIARQYDVDKNSVKLDIGQGFITFSAKKAHSIDLNKLHASIKATRLSGNTGMRVNSLQITVRGILRGPTPESKAPNGKDGPSYLLEVPGTSQEFVLIGDKEGNSAKDVRSPFSDLQEASRRASKQVTVTGFVDGWTSHFPPFLNAPPPPGQAGKPPLIIVSKVTVE